MSRKRVEHRVIDGVEHKHCSRCDQWLPLLFFSGQRRASDGLSCHCRTCCQESASQQRARSKRRFGVRRALHGVDVVVGLY